MRIVVLAIALFGAGMAQAEAITFRQAIRAGYEVKAVTGDPKAGSVWLQIGKSVVICLTGGNNTPDTQCSLIIE
jgi:hypothetical protein